MNSKPQNIQVTACIKKDHKSGWLAEVARRFAAKWKAAYLQTGQRHNPRSQFNCRYESRSKHYKHIFKILVINSTVKKSNPRLKIAIRQNSNSNKNITTAIKSWPTTTLSQEGSVTFLTLLSHHRCCQHSVTVASWQHRQLDFVHSTWPDDHDMITNRQQTDFGRTNVGISGT